MSEEDGSSLFLTPPQDQSDYNNKDSMDYMDFFENSPNNSSTKSEEECSHTAQDVEFCFNCRGDPGTQGLISRNGILKGNLLGNLLLFNCPIAGKDLIKNLFGSVCTPHLLYLNLKDYFLKVRLKIQIIEDCLQPIYGSDLPSGLVPVSILQIRQEIVTFYIYISQCLDREICDVNFCHLLAKEIIDIIRYIGSFDTLPQHITSASSPLGNNCNSAPFHLFHLYLDLRWWSLVVLHQIEKSNPEFKLPDDFPLFVIESSTADHENSGTKSYFNLCAVQVIWDLLTLLERQINSLQVSVTDLGNGNMSSFPCSCSLELAVSLVHLLDYRSPEGFWSQIKSKLLLLLKSVTKSDTDNNKRTTDHRCDVVIVPADSSYSLSLPHLWWIFYKLSQLYNFSEKGEFRSVDNVTMKSESKLLRTFIRMTIMSSPSENELRFYLSSCLSFMELWYGNIDRVHDWIPLWWDFLFKRLNSNFLLSSSGLEGLACLNKSPKDWIDQISLLASGPDRVGGNENSWHLFLRLLVSVRKSESEFKSMKGRIYSKFHAKKMAELNDVGLHNTTTLFLVLAYMRETETVCDKIADLLCSIQLNSVGKHKVVILGLLSIAYLLNEKKIDLENICSRLATQVADISQEFSLCHDPTYKRDIGRLISIYSEGIEDILNSNNVMNSSQHKFFCSSLSYFLANGSFAEKKSILSAIKSALLKVLKESRNLISLAAGTSTPMLETIWQNFGSSLQDQINSETPFLIVGDISAVLIVCSCRVSEPANKSLTERTLNLLTIIIDNEAVSSLLYCKFIDQLLREEKNNDLLGSLYPTYQSKVFATFLSSLIHLGSIEEVITATEVVFKLPGIRKWAPDVPPCPFGATKLFLQQLAERWAKVEDFRSRLFLRETAFAYFGNIDKVLQSLLKRKSLPSHMNEIFSLVSIIFEYGSSLLYIKGKPTCPLAGVMGSVILPHSTYSDKCTNVALAEGLQSFLPKILAGISTLLQPTDLYITRNLKDIIINYLHQYPIASHPFYIFLNNEKNFNTVKFVLECLRDSFITNRKVGQIPLQMAIKLLDKFICSEPAKWLQPICTMTFYTLLELLLRLEDHQTKRCVKNLLETCLNEVEIRQDEVRESVIADIRKFVTFQLSWDSRKVFYILEGLGKLNRRLLVDALPIINEAIKVVEDKRGSGIDQTLRDGLQSLVKSLTGGQII